MSETEKRKIRVFIASPGDLVEERRKFREAIDVLNIGFGDGANVEFIPLGWEDTLASMGRRSQGVINQDIDTCDVFILTMHRRWGQDAPDAAPYSSYTEEEFHRALERWKKDKAPEIFVFFKRVDAASEADPGPQLSKVIKFRQHLEETRQILYRYFDSHESFLNEVDRHLRAYAKGNLPKADERDDTVVLPIAALQEVENAKQLVLQKTEEAKQANDVAEEARLRMDEIQLEMAEDAAKLSMEGKVEFAREKFTKLVVDTTDIQILFLGYEFFKRTGDLDSAFEVLEKWLSLSGAQNNTANTSVALVNFGKLYITRGDLERAEEMFEKSLAIDESLNRKEGLAINYGNLGSLYKIRGELVQAEEMLKKSLAINESLNLQDGLANNYSNLGNIYLDQGNLDRADEMYHKSLAIFEAIGDKEGLAQVYGNLAILYQEQGKVNCAEDLYQKSLGIVEGLGYKECVAIQYGNLGSLFYSRGDVERAEEMYIDALAIHKALGHKEGMANQYNNLGIIYESRSDVERAQVMYEDALAINETLGLKKGIAYQYGNLGILYARQGELEKAKEMFQKSLAINEALSFKMGMAVNYCNLGTMYKTQGKLCQAEEMYDKAIILFREIGSPNEKKAINLLKKLKGSESSSENKPKK